MRSIGGQTHVHCSCNNLPLIPSRRKKNKKRQCGVGTCTSRRKFESFECCSLHCTTRLCKQCFTNFTPDSMHTVDPPIIQQQPNNGDNDNQGNNDDDENEEEDDDDDNNDAELDTEVAENPSEGVPWYRAGDSVQYDAEEGDGNVEADANFENDIRDNFLTDSNYNPQEDLQYGLEE
eukprot:8481569-Ditylum_brightwellii.AAC.1